LMRIVKPRETETQMFDWGTVQWLSEPRVTAAQNFSVGLVLIDVGKGHLRHVHPDAEEVLYVIAGEGEQVVGDVKEPIGPGVLVHIPLGTEHQTLNTGWEPLKALVVYAPPGAEAKYRDMPEVKLIPPGRQPVR